MQCIERKSKSDHHRGALLERSENIGLYTSSNYCFFDFLAIAPINSYPIVKHVRSLCLGSNSIQFEYSTMPY